MSSVLRSKKPGRLARPYVIKLGGELLEEPRRLRQLARALSRLAGQHPLIVVHGGGRAVDTEMTKLGLRKRSVDGLRVTDAPTLDIVLGVLAGRGQHTSGCGYWCNWGPGRRCNRCGRGCP